MTDSLAGIKSQVTRLYKKNPLIHMDIYFKGERKHIMDAEGELTAVYPNIFTVNITEDGIKRKHSFQYADLLTHSVEIKELNIL